MHWGFLPLKLLFKKFKKLTTYTPMYYREVHSTLKKIFYKSKLKIAFESVSYINIMYKQYTLFLNWKY